MYYYSLAWDYDWAKVYYDAEGVNYYDLQPSLLFKLNVIFLGVASLDFISFNYLMAVVLISGLLISITLFYLKFPFLFS